MFDPNALYSVEISTIPGFKVLGIGVQWGSRPDEEDDWVGFHDTCRSHNISDILSGKPMMFLFGSARHGIRRVGKKLMMAYLFSRYLPGRVNR